MKRIFSLLVIALALTGCAQHYDMMLTNGMKITRISKPVLNQDTGQYIYTDALGRKKAISAMRVTDIRPHSNSSQFQTTSDSKFSGPPK